MQKKGKSKVCPYYREDLVVSAEAPNKVVFKDNSDSFLFLNGNLGCHSS